MAGSSFQRTVLDNGLTIVVEKHPVRSASIGVWVKVGSTNESPGISGISHFIEHMLFKGTETRTAFEIATVLESLGGDLNAFTDREVTCYHATVLSEHFGTAIDVLSDMLMHATFPRVELERERSVLLQELSMVHDNPEDWIHDLHFQAVWPKEALGRPIIGNKKTLQKISRAQLLKYFENYYRVDNMVVSVSGNVDFEEVVRLCKKHFTSPQRQEALALNWKAPKYCRRKQHTSADCDQLHMLLGFEGVPFNDPLRYDALVLSFFLGGGMSSRLFQEVRERAGLAYTVECDFIPFSQCGLFTIYVALAPRSLAPCLQILRTELGKLAKTPLTEEELKLVIGQLRGTILLSSDQMEVRQESLARNEITFGRYIPVEEVIGEIEKVTAERIQKLAKKLFIPEKESVVTLGKVKPKGKLTVFA